MPQAVLPPSVQRIIKHRSTHPSTFFTPSFSISFSVREQHVIIDAHFGGGLLLKGHRAALRRVLKGRWFRHLGVQALDTAAEADAFHTAAAGAGGGTALLQHRRMLHGVVVVVILFVGVGSAALVVEALGVDLVSVVGRGCGCGLPSSHSSSSSSSSVAAGGEHRRLL